MQARHAKAMPAVGTAALLLASASLLVGAAVVKDGVHSSLWGKDGELWKPDGRLPDFSFAGYKQGNEPLPGPAVTRSVLDFRQPGMNDTAMFAAAFDWANSQPPQEEGHLVLGIPAGSYTLESRFYIRRSRTIVRGAGRERTILTYPKSLSQLYGPSPLEPVTGGYVNAGAFIALEGSSKKGQGPLLASISSPASKGDRSVTVEDASQLVQGQYVDLWYRDINNVFNTAMFDNEWEPTSKYVNRTSVKLTTKIVSIDGNAITLERYLPYGINPGVVNDAAIYALADTVNDAGVEGLTFAFAWEPYAGHHLERGWCALDFQFVYNCWARNIGTVNADNTVVMTGASAITISDVLIERTESRQNSIPNAFDEPANYDGHWGVHHARTFDILVERFNMSDVKLAHDVGTGSGSKFGVFMDGVMADGNMDLHRALAGPTLYTHIDAGKGTDALSSGGPPASGPNALAGTTWWNIAANRDIKPNKSNGTVFGDCSFGPVINLVMLQIEADELDSMCSTWLYEPDVVEPENIYVAQLEKLRGISYKPPPPVPSLELATQSPSPELAPQPPSPELAPQPSNLELAPQPPALPGAPAPEQAVWAYPPAEAPLPAQATSSAGRFSRLAACASAAAAFSTLLLAL